MPAMSSHNPGTFCWVDLSTTDAAASKSFYSQLLGWTAIDNPVGDGMVYSMMQKDGKNVCGLYEMGPGMEGVPPHWSGYVAVADVDAEVERVTAAGGAVIMPPGDVFEAGRMAFVADSTGAALGLWQAKEHIGAELIQEPGSLGWTELYTHDTGAAASFYNTIFGWNHGAMSMGPEAGDYNTYHTFDVDDQGIAGMMEIRPEWGEVPPNWSIYFCVADVDASFRQAQDLGAEVVVPVRPANNVRFAFLKDPQGIYVGIVQVMG